MLLDKGQEDDWFGSHFITTLVVVAAVCLISLVIWEWFQKAPIIDVRMFKNFNFASSNLMMFTLGIMLFSSLVLMPQFLQTLLGYTSELAGLALSAGGLVLLIEMPIMGQLTTKIQARYLIAFGWLALSIAMFYSTKRIDLQMSFNAAVWLRIAQVIGLGVPVRADHAGGIHRNFAGEEQRGRRDRQFHAQHRKQRGNFHGHHVDRAPLAIPSGDSGADTPGPTIPISRTRSTALASTWLTPDWARMRRRRRLTPASTNRLQAQAASLAYIDTFMVLAVGAAIMFFLTFVLKKNDPGRRGSGSGMSEVE